MPNWVFTSLVVDIDEAKAQEFVKSISGVTPRTADSWTDKEVNFHKLITPDESILEEYLGEYEGLTSEYRNAHPDTNWFAWNSANWHTKWNATDSEIDYVEGPSWLNIHFNTAWAPPQPIYFAMAKRAYEMGATKFRVWWEEEQGYGAEFNISEAGVACDYREWDIPQSHADYEAQEKDCVCSWEDEEYWFADCPREEK